MVSHTLTYTNHKHMTSLLHKCGIAKCIISIKYQQNLLEIYSLYTKHLFSCVMVETHIHD